MDKYTFVEKIGEGSYAVVYRATTADGTQVAIKALKDDFNECVLVQCLKRAGHTNSPHFAAFSR